jgi:hypothetical protein
LGHGVLLVDSVSLERDIGTDYDSLTTRVHPHDLGRYGRPKVRTSVK